MSAAGDPMKRAGSDIADLTRHTHENAVTVLRDPKITVKVKAALDEESGTEHSDIRVHTTASFSGVPLEVFDNE
jgi:osmotically-inducible protein OsmY